MSYLIAEQARRGLACGPWPVCGVPLPYNPCDNGPMLCLPHPAPLPWHKGTPPHPRVPPPSLFCCPNWTRRAGPPGITFAPTGVTTIRRRSLVLTRATALHPYLARGCLPSPSNHLPLFAPSRFPMCPKLREPWGLGRGGACPCGLQGWVTKGRHFLGLDSSALSPPQHPPSIGDLPG